MEGQVGMMNNLNPGPVRIVENPDGSLTQAAMMQVRPVCVSVCCSVCTGLLNTIIQGNILAVKCSAFNLSYIEKL